MKKVLLLVSTVTLSIGVAFTIFCAVVAKKFEKCDLWSDID